MWNVYEHHKGPYMLGVIRETPRRKVKYAYELLPGKVEVDEIEDEARALLADSRDTITSVLVFSASEDQHVTTYTRRQFGIPGDAWVAPPVGLMS